jgi:hypothetical protein
VDPEVLAVGGTVVLCSPKLPWTTVLISTNGLIFFSFAAEYPPGLSAS